MRLHLVGGFLGSGKTTAIIQASRALMRQGQKVGVITNDQGKYLVDTAFVRLSELPALEVTGGCFCCNYADLDSSLDQLIETAHPDIVFAESVGSCADLVATVMKPLLQLKAADYAPTSLSVFSDVRLLRWRLLDRPLPFNDDVVYIFDKQIEEAGLVVLNKADLLQPHELAETLLLFQEAHPGVPALPQSSLSEAGVKAWLDWLASGSGLFQRNSLVVDYDRYGRGEAQLAWLDAEVWITTLNRDARQGVVRLIRNFIADLRDHRVAIGHVKFILAGEGDPLKLSFTTLDEGGWEQSFPSRVGERVSLIVNARVEMEAGKLHQLFEKHLSEVDGVVEQRRVDWFHPAQPVPTHRL